MPLWINDGGSTTWRSVTEFSINDGGSTTWRTVTTAWINDGGSTTWRQIYSNRALASLSGLDYSGSDPTLGLLRISWTTSGDMTGLTITIDADFAGGSTYGSSVDSGVATTATPYDSTLSGMVGFSTLDTTNIRLRLMEGATVVDELTMSGPYAFA